MKAIILLLVFSSGLFADTIRYTVNGEKKVKDNVTFKRTDDKYIYYITSSKSFSKIECDKVIEIISKSGDNINFNCSEEKLLIKESLETKNIDDQLTKTDLLFIGTIVVIFITFFYIEAMNNAMGMSSY